MQITETALPGVLIVEPRLFRDARGFFLESYNAARYREAGLDATFVQDNVSRSARGVLRGLHMQAGAQAQGKLVSVLDGEVFDVAVDARIGSPTYGQWIGETLSAETGRQLFVPPGFLHGFLVTSETALFAYKCTGYYAPEAEFGVCWNDPDIGIEWPIAAPELSAKDAAAPRLRDVPREKLLRAVMDEVSP